MKKYKIGMYGGKFMPLHKGHNYCIETASKECEKVYVIFFHSSADEEKILRTYKTKYLSVEDRVKHIENICKNYKNTELRLIDCSTLRLPNGEEDWEAETPLVRAIVGPKLDAVYSSEISYDDYFKHAYPEATHRIVDYQRIHYPISGTKIRNMKTKKERDLWTI
jgi:HTH-type transcriptional repressor of NAD biosynthesis genes